MDEKFTVGIIVSNHFGVLNRVSGLYGKRGFNIDSLAVGTTEDEKYSRITIVSSGNLEVRTQVVKQLRKLHDVKKVFLFDNKCMLSTDHLLIKIQTDSQNNSKVSSFINSFGGKVRDFGENFITAEITGETKIIDKFIEKCNEFDILEVCRSGAISMSCGIDDNLNIKNINKKGELL